MKNYKQLVLIDCFEYAHDLNVKIKSRLHCMEANSLYIIEAKGFLSSQSKMNPNMTSSQSFSQTNQISDI